MGKPIPIAILVLALAVMPGCRPLTYAGAGLAVLGGITVGAAGIGCLEHCGETDANNPTEDDVDDRDFGYLVAFSVGLSAMAIGGLVAGFSFAFEPRPEQPLDPAAEERKRKEEEEAEKRRPANEGWPE